MRASKSQRSTIVSLLRSGLRLARKVAGGTISRRNVELDLVETSSLFDREWYLRAYKDISGDGIDPLWHFMTDGWREGRDPGPHFMTSAYLKANPDIAKSGVNPLVHYLEHGHAEGRETFSVLPIAPPVVESFEFGAASPCASFPLPALEDTPWRGAASLESERSNVLAFDGLVVGYIDSQAIGADVQSDLVLLKALSGWGEFVGPTTHSNDGLTEHVSDAWFANSSRLRTRWSSDRSPFVVRSYQVDVVDGSICLLSEKLVSSPLEFFDIPLLNSLFPILFVLAELDGTLRGTRLMAFPSLCRGGPHYPELVRSAETSATVNPFIHGELLADKLVRLACRNREPAISKIQVDLTDADGTTLLFQSDFRQWLERVVRVRVEPLAQRKDSKADQFLAKSVSLTPSPLRDPEGGALIIAHDMVPTIAALTEFGSAGTEFQEIGVPLLIADGDPAQPGISVTIPGKMADVLDKLPCPFASRWPRLKAGGKLVGANALPACAILLASKRVHNAQLFMPVAPGHPINASDVRAPITWLIHSGDRNLGNLKQTVRALKLQDGSSGDVIVLVGPAARDMLRLVKNEFGGRVIAFRTVSQAADAVTTPLVCFVGAGVVLHDRRTASVFASLLENVDVTSASCVLISVNAHRRASHASIQDSGLSLADAAGNSAHSIEEWAIEHLWGTHFPSSSPPADLWAVRSSHLAKWVDPDGTQFDELHIRTSLVTATHVGQSERRPHPLVPEASKGQVTRLEAFFG